MNKEPFVISVPDATLTDLCARLARTRRPEEWDNENWQYGTNLAYLTIVTADPPAQRAHARRQGWDNLRLLGTADGSTFKFNLGSEDREGNQDSTLVTMPFRSK